MRSISSFRISRSESTPEACIGKIIRNQLEIIFPRVTTRTYMCIYVGKWSKVVGGGSFETIDNGCSTNGRSVSCRGAYFRNTSSLVRSFVRSSACVNAARGAVSHFSNDTRDFAVWQENEISEFVV